MSKRVLYERLAWSDPGFRGLKDSDRFYLMERLAAFLAFFSAFLSFIVLDGAFLVCFFLSIALLIVIAPFRIVA